jgi:hypothetical protein
MNGTEVSLYQTKGVEQTLNRLPVKSPIIIMMTRDPSGELGISDALTLVMVYGKTEKEDLKLAMVVRFENESTAVESLGSKETFLDLSILGIDIDTRQGDTFVEMELEIPAQLLSP